MNSLNPNIDLLHPYPFEKLRALVAGITPNPALPPLSLGIGEPQHNPPKVATDALVEHLNLVAKYPATLGLPQFRETLGAWLTRRFDLTDFDPNQHVIPVTGTREALFAIVQALVPAGRTVAMPNPFYQIYEGATLMAGAQCEYLATDESNNYLPDIESIDDLDRVAMVFICTPGNPSGRVFSIEEMQHLIKLARKHDFVLVSDECYSEIYRDEDAPPPGLLQAAATLDAGHFSHCLAVGSLSKRSNLPGLRSGYIAGDEALLNAFSAYRTYHGCAMPGHHQYASMAAWNDEDHVRENRSMYRAKFGMALDILGDYIPNQPPAAGFYLWPRVPGDDDEGFTRFLLQSQNLRVLPGRYLGREINGVNPGAGHFRAALVSSPDTTKTALTRLKTALDAWSHQ